MARPGRGDAGAYDAAHNILTNLDIYVKDKRTREGLSLRAAAEQAGINHTLLHRIENGGQATTDTIQAVLKWLAA